MEESIVKIILFVLLALIAFVLGYLNYKGILISLTLARRNDHRSKKRWDNIGRCISYFLIGLSSISYLLKDYWGGITSVVLLLSGCVLATVIDIIAYIKQKKQ